MPLGLLAASAIGKLSAALSLDIDWTAERIAVFLWQDLTLAIAFAGLLAGARRSRLCVRLLTLAYAATILLVIVNIPVERALFTPLTSPMVRAARGPLAGSFLPYITWINAAWCALALTLAVVLPRLTRRAGGRLASPAGWCLVITAVATAAIGASRAGRTPTLGLERNVVFALVASHLAQIEEQPRIDETHVSPFPLAPGTSLAQFSGVARGWNIVLVSFESTAASHLPPYGAEERGAPRLAELARRALIFDAAYAVYPESIKGLESILCARYPAFDTTPNDYATLPCPSAAAALDRAGYGTALFHSGRFGYLGMQKIVERAGYRTLEDAGAIGGQEESSFGVDEESTVSHALAWIDRRSSAAPFFLTYLPIAGHHPYDSPAGGPFAETSERERHMNAVFYADRALGLLVDGIRARGLADRTLWFIIGDHGEAFGEHDANFGHTFHLYDENVRVPMIVALPALDAPLRVAAPSSLADVTPTLLELAGVDFQSHSDGRSALHRPGGPAPFFTDYSRPLAGLRDGRWKAIHEIGTSRTALFDLDLDRGERHDVSAAHGDRADWYRQWLIRWSAAQKHRVLSGE